MLALLLSGLILLQKPEIIAELQTPEKVVSEIKTCEDIDIIEAQEETTDGWQYFGVCTVSHYCNCSICCGQWAGGGTASGVAPTPGRTVAHNYLPFGTRVLINGVEYVVEDRGDDNMSGGMWFDVFCGSHSEALQKGLYNADVYVIY